MAVDATMTLAQAGMVARNLDCREAAEMFCTVMRTTVAELTARHDRESRWLRTVGDLPRLRAAVWWHLRQVKVGAGPKWSYPDIARVFDTGHSTIIEGVRRHERTGAK